MRTKLIGGLALAMGITAGPAFGQVARPTTPPARAAQLSGFIAVPDSTQAGQNVSPAGLLTPGQDTTSIPSPMPIAQGGLPTAGVTLPVPRPVTSAPPLAGTPTVTEVRVPDGTLGVSTSPIDSPSVLPTPAPLVPSIPVPLGTPTPIPLVTPDGIYPPGCDPQFGDCPTGAPAVNRVKSCEHWYASAEYLMWWTRSMQVPALLTTSPPGSNGILGEPGTRVLYGGDVGNTYHGGGRFTLGRWFCDDPTWGVEGRILFLGESQSSFTANSNQYPVLARPFFNVNTPVGQFSELITFPGLAAGNALIKTSTSIWGAEANARRVLFGNPNGSGFELDAIIGYRYFDLDERLSVEEAFTRVPGSPMTVGTPAIAGNVLDTFHTTDVFNGGQIGLNGMYQYGRWSIEGRTTVAFGNLDQTAMISGSQYLVFANGVAKSYTGGLLALPGANIGTFHHNQFCVLPEVTLDVGYQITRHWRAFIGYDFLFIGNALRPGGAIDTNVDAARIPNFPVTGGSTTPLPGAPRPGPYFTTSDFFAQGINFGLEFRW